MSFKVVARFNESEKERDGERWKRPVSEFDDSTTAVKISPCYCTPHGALAVIAFIAGRFHRPRYETNDQSVNADAVNGPQDPSPVVSCSPDEARSLAGRQSV